MRYWGTASIAVSALLAMCFAAATHAQNIVPNANFDSQLAPWTPLLSSSPDPVGAGAAPVRVSSPDLNGATSGSAQVDISASPTTPDATNAASGIHQCIDFHTAPVTVNFVNYGGSFLVPSTTGADGSINATVEMRLFAGANCTQFITAGSQGRTLVPGLSSDTTWYAVSDNNFVPPTVGVTVASAEVRAYLRETGSTLAQTDYQANFDKFFLIFNSTTPVRLVDFSVE